MVDTSNVRVEQHINDPSDVFTDQREKLQEDLDMSEEEAEEIYKGVKTQIMLSSQEAGKKYSTETINALTNLAVASQRMEIKQMIEEEHTTTINVGRFLYQLIISVALILNVIIVYSSFPDEIIGLTLLNVLVIPLLLYFLTK